MSKNRAGVDREIGQGLPEGVAEGETGLPPREGAKTPKIRPVDMPPVRPRQGVRGKTAKHPLETRELAEKLYLETSTTLDEASRLLRLPRSSVQKWWDAMPAPVHRPKSAAPRPITDAYERENARLRAEIARLASELATRGSDPHDTLNLLGQAKREMAGRMPTMTGTELASVHRALASHLPAENAAQSTADRGRAEAVLARIENRMLSFSRPEMRAVDLGTRPEKVRRDDE